MRTDFCLRRLGRVALPGLVVFVGVVGFLGLPACREAKDPPESPPADPGGPIDLGRGDLRGRPNPTDPTDLRSRGDLASVPMPPPASCNQRAPGKTAIQAVLSIDEYRGLYTGRNGTHENADATLVTTVWVYAQPLIDTNNVSLAMLVDRGEGHGLPDELPLTRGQIIEVEGEYIPAATSGAMTKKGPAAVIHFTHSPCGFAIIGGSTYY